MLLAIDVGNTNMVFGLYDGDKLRGSFRISTNSERTSDELGMLIAQITSTISPVRIRLRSLSRL
ncbi:MAG: type III pantothenate kinase [Butyricicoccus sp.]